MDVKEMARMGGLARAKALTKEQLSRIGRKGAKASAKVRSKRRAR